jgi:hypothetical protein
MATGVAWFATGQVPGTPPPDPAVVGAQAASELRLSSPSLVLSPSKSGYVNLAEWLWIDPAIWHPFTTTAQACTPGGCMSASATATPAYVTWNTGDGTTVTCSGPGTAYNTAMPADAQSTYCSHTYTKTSSGQPTPDGNPNDEAVRSGERILSAYDVGTTRLWIITDAEADGPTGPSGVRPRHATTLLLPSEY